MQKSKVNITYSFICMSFVIQFEDGTTSVCHHDISRPFFPSSIAVDQRRGTIFVADLYNDAVYVLNADGSHIGTVTKPSGITSSRNTYHSDAVDGCGPFGAGETDIGGPTALAVDSDRQLLYVASNGRAISVYRYRYATDVTRQVPGDTLAAVL